MWAKKATVVMLVVGMLFIGAGTASAYSVSFSSGNLAASADFTASGGILTVVLTNTSAADVAVPSDVLTALFFNIVGVGALTPVSAVLSGGSTVLFDPAPAGGVVGGEWAYGAGLSGAPGGATEGISSAGFGLFGNANFPGTDLEPPTAVDGLQYGITSAGDNPLSGNSAVTGNFPLIKNQVTFTLSGLPLTDFELNSNNVTNVSFQYGTNLDEPNSGCVGPSCFSTVPAPSALLMLGAGLIGMGGFLAYRKRS